MTMRARVLLTLFGFMALAPAVAVAQDFGVLESAEIIDVGNFKVRANPLLIFGKDGGDSRVGAAVLVGYGFTPRFDAEGGVAVYDGLTFFGGNGEFSLAKRDPFDFSVSLGLHGRRGDQTVDATGVDLTFLPSKHVTSKLDLYGALDFAFESISDSFGGGSFRTVHFVPGIEYRFRPDIDLLVEVGLALNDSARHYASAGIAFYLR